MRTLEKYSFGIGDRFGHQGKAQLQAMIYAQEAGVQIVPVWNKSNREHGIIHTQPAGVRAGSGSDDAWRRLHRRGQPRYDPGRNTRRKCSRDV